MTQLDKTNSDEHFRDWMRDNLTRAAAAFGVRVDGQSVMGWGDRSIGAPVRSEHHTYWLRVVSEFPTYINADWWSGNADANRIRAVAMPRVLAVEEWHERDWRTQRAELMTIVPGKPISQPGGIDSLRLPLRWWSALTSTLQHIRATPTERMTEPRDRIDARLRDALGDDVALPELRWETVHGDLHWQNLLAEPFGLLDWEFWGRGPACLDEATLYCASLHRPDLATVVFRELGDRLDSRDGRIAQLYAAARLLRRSQMEDPHGLSAPLRRLLDELRGDVA